MDIKTLPEETKRDKEAKAHGRKVKDSLWGPKRIIDDLVSTRKFAPAMTKPTGKNRFAAGRKGRTSQAVVITSCLERSSPVLRAVRRRWRKKARVRRVAKFLGSEREVRRGTEPIVQSQHKEEGQSRRPRLIEMRWERVRMRGRGGAWLPGLSNLVKTGREEPCSLRRARRRRTRGRRRERRDGREGRRRGRSSQGRGEDLLPDIRRYTLLEGSDWCGLFMKPKRDVPVKRVPPSELMYNTEPQDSDSLLLAEHGQACSQAGQEETEAGRGGGLQEGEQREQEEDGGEQFCSANSPGNGLGVDGVDSEEEGGEEGGLGVRMENEGQGVETFLGA